MDTTTFIKGLWDNNMWYLYLGSLISSDTLVSIEDCDKSMSQVLELREAIPKSELPEEEKIKALELLDKAEAIITRDKKELEG